MNGGIYAWEGHFWFGLYLGLPTIFEMDPAGHLIHLFDFPAAEGGVAGVGGLDRDAQGHLYVADPMGQKLRVFSAAGDPLREVGGDRTPYERAGLNFVDEPGILEDPNDVVVDQEGFVYVACGEQFMRNGVQKFAPDGSFVGSFGSLGDPEAVFGGPRGITQHPDGSIWVCDTLHHRLQVFSPEGRFLRLVGAPHKESMTAPLAVTFLPGGEILVAEGSTRRCLSVFDDQGNFLRKFAPQLSRDLVTPTDVYRDGDQVYVFERDFSDLGLRIRRFRTDGTPQSVLVASQEDLVDKVIRLLRKGVEEGRPAAPAHLRMAHLYHYVLPPSAPAHRRARQHYHRALELDPESFEARWDLAELELLCGNLEEARRLYQECRALRPGDDSVAIRLALTWERQDDLSRACQVLRSALAEHPDSQILLEELTRLEGSRAEL